MKAKEYLGQLNKYNSIIKSKLVEVQRWKDIATSISITQDGDRVQSSGNQNKVANAVAMYVDLEEELLVQISAYESKRQEILKTIENLNAEEYDVVYSHFVLNQGYQEIADNMQRSYRWVTSVNGTALQKIQKIIDKENR